MKRKAISIGLTLALCVSLAVPTFAVVSETMPSITINPNMHNMPDLTITLTNFNDIFEGVYGREYTYLYISTSDTSSTVSFNQEVVIRYGSASLGQTKLMEAGEIIKISDYCEEVSSDSMVPVFVIGTWDEEEEKLVLSHIGFYVIGKSFASSYYSSEYDGRRMGVLYRMESFAVDSLAEKPPVPPTVERPSSWAEAEVRAAIEAGLVPESLQKNYNSPVTRGEVAQMFVNLIEKVSNQTIDDFLASKGVAINADAFPDTSDKAVLAANALGVILGNDDGTFGPDKFLQRAQIAAVINRTAGVMGIDTSGYTHSFPDVTDHWAAAELGWPAAMKIILGNDDGTFAPKRNLSTQEAIIITYRAIVPLSQF